MRSALHLTLVITLGSAGLTVPTAAQATVRAGDPEQLYQEGKEAFAEWYPKALAEATISADNPTAAAVICTRVPTCMPATDTNAALRPWVAPRATTYSTAGPGSSNNSRAAPENRNRVCGVGTAEP